VSEKLNWNKATKQKRILEVGYQIHEDNLPRRPSDSESKVTRNRRKKNRKVGDLPVKEQKIAFKNLKAHFGKKYDELFIVAIKNLLMGQIIRTTPTQGVPTTLQNEIKKKGGLTAWVKTQPLYRAKYSELKKNKY